MSGATPGTGAAPAGTATGGLRILLATPPAAAVGPIPRLTSILVEELRRLGCEVTLCDWGSSPDQTTAAARATGRLKDMLAIWRQARAHDVVVVATAHYRNTVARDVPLLLGLRTTGTPAVLQFHGSRPEVLSEKGGALFKVGSRVLLGAAAAVMVLSSEEKRAWERFQPRVRAFVVKNPYAGVAADARPGDAAPADEAGLEPPALLFVGRLLAFKGVFDLVEAAGMLATAHPDLPFQVVMAGDGPEAGAITAMAEKLGVRDRVVLTGHLGAADLAALYRRAAVFVLPSHLEGFPTVIAEAMDAGLPIVTTAIRGAVDHLAEGVNALLVPPRDPARLADALATLLKDSALRTDMGRENQRKVAIFAPAAVAAEYLHILQNVTAGAAAGR